MSSTLTAPALNVPEKAPLVRCYYLGDYERNGYNDSDFHVVFWDDVNGEIKNVEHSSTRYGGGWNYHAELIRAIPADVLARLRAYLYAHSLAAYTLAETSRVMEPQPASLSFGARVRLLKDSRKGCKTPYRAGEVGEVFGSYWYGTFYANGYNQKTRFNGRVGLRMSDGRKIFAAMTVVRLDCEPDMVAVERNARSLSESDSVRCPGAWWSNVATLTASL